MCLWIYILVGSITLVVLGIFIFPKLVDDKVYYELPTILNSDICRLYSINGVGTMLIKGFRQCVVSSSQFQGISPSLYDGICVGYQFITFLNLPLIPLGCYAFSTGGISGTKRHRYQNYRIYSSLKWSCFELLSIYFNSWGSVGCILSLFAIIFC